MELVSAHNPRLRYPRPLSPWSPPEASRASWSRAPVCRFSTSLHESTTLRDRHRTPRGSNFTTVRRCPGTAVVSARNRSHEARGRGQGRDRGRVLCRLVLVLVRGTGRQVGIGGFTVLLLLLLLSDQVQTMTIHWTVLERVRV